MCAWIIIVPAQFCYSNLSQCFSVEANELANVMPLFFALYGGAEQKAGKVPG